MHSQMMGPAVNPLDMILGLGGATPVGEQGSLEKFNEMLNLYPLSSVKSIEGLVAGDNAQVQPQIESAGMTMVQIPESLLESFGLHTGIIPKTTPNPLPPIQGEPQLAVPAELLVADNGSGETIYLKIHADAAANESGVILPTAEDDGQEMLLPMRLRTVEQVGNRLIADAELQGAAGKDNLIRLRLELAGNTSGNQELNWRAVEETAGQSASGKPGAMSKMLGALGVKLIVIENVENGSATTLQSVLPETAPIFKKVTGIKTVRQPNSAASVVDAVITGEKGEGVKVANPSIANASFDALVRERSDGGGAFSGATGENTAFGERLAAMTSNPGASEVASTTLSDGSSLDTKIESASVRFYDLDHKLDQLKQSPGRKISVQLAPAKLGRMELTIASHRGVVTVNLVVESAQARQAVEKNLSQLESRLAASGIKVDSFQVTVNQPAKGESFAGTHSQHHQGEFAGNQHQGGQNRGAFIKNQLRDFKNAGIGFDKVLVNCLA